MSLTRNFIESAPVRTQLEFGINKNVRFIKLHNDDILKDGIRLNKNTHMTFGKYNEQDELIASTTFSYWDLDSTKDFVRDNFVSQLSHFMSLISLYAPHEMGTFNAIFADTINTDEDLMSILKNKTKCLEFQKLMITTFIKIMKPYVNEMGPLVKLKVVTSKDGKYLELPSSAQFIELNEIPDNESILKIVASEKLRYEAGFKVETEKPDNKSNKPDINI